MTPTMIFSRFIQALVGGGKALAAPSISPRAANTEEPHDVTPHPVCWAVPGAFALLVDCRDANR